ncbi:BglI family type II restriction endonuclease [uncultured Campylobacter sp.]
MKEICHFIDLYLPEIQRDYNEASYLYSFWKNYPPFGSWTLSKG